VECGETIVCKIGFKVYPRRWRTVTATRPEEKRPTIRLVRTENGSLAE